jgi:hypothetical protein
MCVCGGGRGGGVVSSVGLQERWGYWVVRPCGMLPGPLRASNSTCQQCVGWPWGPEGASARALVDPPLSALSAAAHSSMLMPTARALALTLCQPRRCCLRAALVAGGVGERAGG